MQTRRVVAADDGREFGTDRQLRLGHGEHGHERRKQRETQGDDDDERARGHQRSPRPRASTVTESGSFCSVADEESVA